MSYEEAENRANELGFSVHMHNGERNWFNAIKRWDYTGQSYSLEVWTDTEEFKFSKLVRAIEITTGKCGSFKDDGHFMSWQRSFLDVIERLAVLE